MAEIQFGVWNIEWMNSLFEGDPPQFKAGDTKVRGPRKNNTVDDRIADVSGVINEMDLQVLVVVEGPNRVEELQLFFDRTEINGDWKCAVQQSGAQSVGLAVRTDTGVFQDPPFSQFDSSLADQAPLLKELTDPFLMLYGEFVKGNGQITNELNNQVNSHLTTYPSDHYKLPIIHRGNYINTNNLKYCFVLDGYSRYVVHWEIRERMTERDVEIVLQGAREKFPQARPRVISDNGPQFIARDFKEFIRISGMTHVRTSFNYPQSNGKLERWHGSLWSECIRPGTPLSIEDARRLVQRYVDYYNNQRLHSALGYIAPKDKLAGREETIFADRARKLKEARERRRMHKVEKKNVQCQSLAPALAGC